MEEAQEFLEMLVREGYFPAEIAEKLDLVGISYTLEGDTFTIVSNEGTPSPQVAASPTEEVSILSCMSDIVENTTISYDHRDDKFNKEVFNVCREQIRYVCDMVGITPEQAVILSTILENKGRRCFGKHDLAGEMGLSFIKLLSYEKDIRELAERRLINLVKNDRITIGNNVIEALASNKPYSIPEPKGLSTPEILKEMNEIISSRENSETEYDTMLRDLDALFRNNPEAGLVQEAKTLGFDSTHMNEQDRVIFYVLVRRYIYNNDDNVMWDDFDDILDDMSDVGRFRSDFNSERFELQRLKVVEPCSEDGMAAPDQFHLTDAAKAKLFAEVGGVRNKTRRTALKVMSPDDITARKLFYNDSEGDQIARLTKLLSQESYKATCERLKKSGMRTGFSCLF
ncbi:MAG: hypothetical protein HUJ91_07830, partial [Bacteroidales bacterium]|nr:hypothetical protein [Bacteroidales bacterium]